ncbi:MAG: hypothetical protein O3B21_03350 [Proteobacteria bacterium]|nr:hypothetical protein [Pseudomonadota bacterium]MDA1357025.1 hypothetical protein [Pseudomonadota bacterium]
MQAAAQGLHAPHGLQGFAAAQGLHGLQAPPMPGTVHSAAAPHAPAPQGLQGLQAAPQGLHGLQAQQGLQAPQGFAAAHGLQGLQALHAARIIWPTSALRATAAGFSPRVAALAGCMPLTAATLMPITMGMKVLESNLFFCSMPCSLEKILLSHYSDLNIRRSPRIRNANPVKFL